MPSERQNIDGAKAQEQRCLLLVDALASAYRSFHAIRSLTSPSGAPTNAIFGFIKAFVRARDQVKPSHAAVVWDGGLASERMALVPEYKAQRPPMPKALESQLDEIVAWLEAFRVTSLYRDGVEADDWIGSLARRAEADGFQVVIVSSDKDFMQLVNSRIGLLNSADASRAIWTEAEVRAKTGVPPGAIVDYLSLVGDSVDNISGVPGVGPKTAAKLLGEFGSWEGILSHLDAIPSERLREVLRQSVAIMERNRKMVRLDETVGTDIRLEDLAVGVADPAGLRVLYGRWGFKGLLGELPKGEAEQGELF